MPYTEIDFVAAVVESDSVNPIQAAFSDACLIHYSEIDIANPSVNEFHLIFKITYDCAIDTRPYFLLVNMQVTKCNYCRLYGPGEWVATEVDHDIDDETSGLVRLYIAKI